MPFNPIVVTLDFLGFQNLVSFEHKIIVIFLRHLKLMKQLIFVRVFGISGLNFILLLVAQKNLGCSVSILLP